MLGEWPNWLRLSNSPHDKPSALDILYETFYTSIRAEVHGELNPILRVSDDLGGVVMLRFSGSTTGNRLIPR